MILTIDIGNTYIRLGAAEKKEVLFLERISTNTLKTDLEYSVDILGAFRLHDIDLRRVEGAILASVVPDLEDVLGRTVERIFRFRPVIVKAGTQNILKVDIDHPEELGANLIINAAAAFSEYGGPVIVIDLGTATSIGAVTKEGVYKGGAILPGVQTALSALAGGTAQLPELSVDAPLTVLGRNTPASMNGGTVYGNAGMIDGVLTRMEKELMSGENAPENVRIIATGKPAGILCPYLRHRVLRDDFLPMKGLSYIYYASKGVLL